MAWPSGSSADDSAAETMAGAVLVAVGAGEVELALAGVEQCLASLDERLEGAGFIDIEGLPAGVKTDDRGQREERIAFGWEIGRALMGGAAKVDALGQRDGGGGGRVPGRVMGGDAFEGGGSSVTIGA